ncbi:MAG: hypothetical protein JXB29_11470 [Sedimentisphaerales bacterium]|nr:hypothetical protein [Sedimentisphaerales bacterium]
MKKKRLAVYSGQWTAYERQTVLFFCIHVTLAALVPSKGLSKPTETQKAGALRTYEEHRALHDDHVTMFTIFRL